MGRSRSFWMFWTERIFVEVLDWIKEEGKEALIFFT